ncbi:glycosyltransferase [Priestia megaterium]
MNENKICFIYCVNDWKQYDQSIQFVKRLTVPPELVVECITIEKTSSLTSGYNYAMNKTDAKYKVYLHQDVYILNNNFILDILNLFKNHPKLGLLGVAGAKTIPESGIWWESEEKYGKVQESHTGQMSLLQFGEVENDFESIMAVDGLIMITQYDILWRADLFKGWHFYDLSHCFEMIKAGYLVGIPQQKEPWCMHDCGIPNISNGFDEDRKLFINTYINKDKKLVSEMIDNHSKEKALNGLYTKFTISTNEKTNAKNHPLVSVLIPSYNRPHYLELALKSVLNQTYKNIEIIICDDSTNDDVKKMLVPYLDKYENIQYVKNEKRLINQNVDRCFELAKGEYINYLLDDDLFHSEKIEKMLSYFLNNEDISLVTSCRQAIDSQGNHISIGGGTTKMYHETTIIDGKQLMDFVFKNCLNIIGEWTTVMFKKNDCTEKMSSYKDKSYFVVQDVAMWAKLLIKGRAVYIPEALSYFRYHLGQRSSETKIQILAIEEWVQLMKDAHQDGYLANEMDFKVALSNHLKQTSNIIQSILMSNSLSLIKELHSEEKINDSISFMVKNIIGTLDS